MSATASFPCSRAAACTTRSAASGSRKIGRSASANAASAACFRATSPAALANAVVASAWSLRAPTRRPATRTACV